jgi:hypothetical protein
MSILSDQMLGFPDRQAIDSSPAGFDDQGVETAARIYASEDSGSRETPQLKGSTEACARIIRVPPISIGH